MRLYVRREASPEQIETVREYLMDDSARFDLLLDMLRRRAMNELAISPSDDFLPSQLQACSPAIFAESLAFDTDESDESPRISANIIPTQQPDMFELLRSVFLEEE